MADGRAGCVQAGSVRGRAGADRPVLARGQLPVRGADLPAGQPTASRTAAGRAGQAAAAGALGHHAWPEPAVCAHEPGDQAAGRQRDLHHRSGPRRPRPGGQRLSGGHVQRGVLLHRAGRGRDAGPVPAVLLPRRDTQPRGAGNTRLDPRGRRAGVRAGARLRGGVRQSRPGCPLRRGRRRGGDRSAGGQLAFQQVPQPGDRRRGAACAAPERVQDRQPDGAGAHPGRRAGRADARLRLPAALRGGRRPGGRAPAAGGDAGRGHGRHLRHPAGRPSTGARRRVQRGR